MVETNDRKLPVGIQSFEEFRMGGYLYVDKTDIIWQLANKGKKYTSNPQPIGFRGNLLVKRQKFFYCTYSLGITETS